MSGAKGCLGSPRYATYVSDSVPGLPICWICKLSPEQQVSCNVNLAKMIECESFPSGLNMTHSDIVLVALLSHSSSPASALAGLVSYVGHYDTEA